LVAPLVSVIVLNWNTPQETLHCLQSLENLSYPNYQVLVVDNGSGDDSVDVFTEFVQCHPQFTLFVTGENLGFSGGVNYGIDVALSLGAIYIWLLNSDTEVAPDCLSALVNAMEHDPKVAIAGSRIFLQSQRGIIWHAGASFARGIVQPRHRGMGADQADPRYSTSCLVEYVTGCSLLVRAMVIQQIGKLDDRFYLYYEEADLCYRSRRQGWKIFYVAESQLWHKVAGSSTGFYARNYYEVRNRLLFTVKHKPYNLPLVLSYLLFQEILKPFLKGDWKSAWFGWLGCIDFFRAKFGRL
jgi:GT2 family glycosyltransferase